MRAVIFANGVIENFDRARAAAESADLVMAADGGTEHGLRLGVIPEIVIGDLDSLDAEDRLALESDGTEFIQHPADKDQTDLELALLYALSRGVDKIIILGAMGGRLDMTLANLQLLALPELSAAQVELWHAEQTAWLIRPPGGPILGKPGDLVSLIPMGGNASGITSQDLQYSLIDETLDLGPARGISNVVSGPNPNVEMHSGTLLVVHTRGVA
ncbi:MAG: thiamine diphosphokinase [Anaerolineales bacterium]